MRTWPSSNLPEALQGLSYSVDYRPVLFAGLLKHHGQLGPAEIAGKRDWTYRQVLWLAHSHGVPLQMPAAHPFNPLACCAWHWPAAMHRGRVNRYVCETVCCAMCGAAAPTPLDPARLQAWPRSCNPRRTPQASL
jgi:2-hydroxychromene-2-carboxylate isomerase